MQDKNKTLGLKKRRPGGATGPYRRRYVLGKEVYLGISKPTNLALP